MPPDSLNQASKILKTYFVEFCFPREDRVGSPQGFIHFEAETAKEKNHRTEAEP